MRGCLALALLLAMVFSSVESAQAIWPFTKSKPAQGPVRSISREQAGLSEDWVRASGYDSGEPKDKYSSMPHRIWNGTIGYIIPAARTSPDPRDRRYSNAASSGPQTLKEWQAQPRVGGEK